MSLIVGIPSNVAGCFELMVGSGGSGFWGGNPPTDPKGLGSVVGDLPPTVGLVGSGGGRSVSGGSGGLVG